MENFDQLCSTRLLKIDLNMHDLQKATISHVCMKMLAGNRVVLIKRPGADDVWGDLCPE